MLQDLRQLGRHVQNTEIQFAQFDSNCCFDQYFFLCVVKCNNRKDYARVWIHGFIFFRVRRCPEFALGLKITENLLYRFNEKFFTLNVAVNRWKRAVASPAILFSYCVRDVRLYERINIQLWEIKQADILTQLPRLSSQLFRGGLQRVDACTSGVCSLERAPATESRSAVPIRLIYHRATEVFITLDITGTPAEGPRRQRKEIGRNGKNKARRPLFFNKTCPGRFAAAAFRRAEVR